MVTAGEEEKKKKRNRAPGAIWQSRGLRCKLKGFCDVMVHCWDRRAFLLAFIFSRRFTRWVLVISISSILSRAVRSWKDKTPG